MAKIDLERQRLELKKELTKFVMSRSHGESFIEKLDVFIFVARIAQR